MGGMELGGNDNKLEISNQRKILQRELTVFANEVIKLKNNATELEQKLHEFSTKYPNQQLYLGYKLVDLGYASFCIKVIPEKIQDETERLCLAQKLAGTKYDEMVINNMQKFGLKSEKNRLELAKTIAKKKGFRVAVYIEKFDIRDEKERLKLAQFLVKDSGSSLIYNIDKFNISNEQDRLNLAKSLVKKNGSDLAYKIDKFKIENVRDRVDLAKELILKASNKLIVNIEVEFIQKRLVKSIDTRANLYEPMLEKVCMGIDTNDSDIIKDIDMCKKLIGNIKKLQEFYIREQKRTQLKNVNFDDINFDVSGLLKKDNSEAIKAAINNIGNEAQKQFIIETVEKMLFIISQRTLQIPTMRKDELTKLIVEFVKIRNPELKVHLLPMMLTATNEDKLHKISEEMKNNNKTKGYPAISALVFDKLLLYKEDNKLLSDIRKVFSKNSFLKNTKNVCDTLMALIKLGDLYLKKEETNNIVKFLVKAPDNISKNSRYIMSIISFGNKDELRNIHENSNPNAIKELFYNIYNRYISMENNEEFMADYERFVNLKDNVNRKFEEQLMIYVSNNRDETVLVGAIKKYLTTMTDIQRFRNYRYDVKSREHLESLQNIDSEVYRKWSKGQKEFEELYLNEASTSVPTIGTAKITDDPVDLFLIGTEIDGSCQHVNGVGYNIALMGYVLDGKNKAVVIKNEAGRIIARSIIRLLIDKDTNDIVMTKERLYTANGVSDDIDEELNIACVKYAKWLGIPLVCHGSDERNKCRRVLLSKDCTAPYEYVDMNYGMTRGKYEVVGPNLIYLYDNQSQLPRP